ncbi:MAG: hypothetical protein K8R02_03340 [Anaerohalosphaeraceae bacterium]|nr:hypothetical protein [Anaerohalosphaeraceae bacterium]
MRKKTNAFGIVFALVIAAVCVGVVQAKPKSRTFLREGFLLDGRDGVVFSNEDSTKWFFTPFEVMTDGRNTTAANSSIEILKSSVLERLVKDSKGELGAFRFWGKMTRYGTKNYIYLSFFLPVTDAAPAAVEDVNVAEPNVVSIVPDDVMAMLRPKRVVNFADIRQGVTVESDGVILDRTGFLREADGRYYFDFDALGRNVDSQSFELLNSDFLEMMYKRQSESAELLRYKISAILTSFKGNYYLLIQRAIVAHSYGNFSR